LAIKILPSHASRTQINKLKAYAKHFVLDDPYLWNFCTDKVIRRCITDGKFAVIMHHCHDTSVRGHSWPQRTARRVLDNGFY